MNDMERHTVVVVPPGRGVMSQEYQVRFQFLNGKVRSKVWKDGEREPRRWTYGASTLPETGVSSGESFPPTPDDAPAHSE